jgi:hypothetical protein
MVPQFGHFLSTLLLGILDLSLGEKAIITATPDYVSRRIRTLRFLRLTGAND